MEIKKIETFELTDEEKDAIYKVQTLLCDIQNKCEKNKIERLITLYNHQLADIYLDDLDGIWNVLERLTSVQELVHEEDMTY